MALDSCEAFSLALAGSRNSSASPDDLIQERNHRLELFGPSGLLKGREEAMTTLRIGSGLHVFSLDIEGLSPSFRHASRVL